MECKGGVESRIGERAMTLLPRNLDVDLKDLQLRFHVIRNKISPIFSIISTANVSYVCDYNFRIKEEEIKLNCIDQRVR